MFSLSWLFSFFCWKTLDVFWNGLLAESMATSPSRVEDSLICRRTDTSMNFPIAAREGSGAEALIL